MLQQDVFLFFDSKIHFLFSLCQKGGVFANQAANKRFKMVHPYFSKILGHLTWIRFRRGCLKPFPPPLVKKTNSCRISRKSVRFELQVHDIMLMIFPKNHFQMHNMIFRQRSTASLARLGPELRIFMPAVLSINETGIRNSKMDLTM